MIFLEAALILIVFFFLASCSSREITSELDYLKGLQKNDVIILSKNCNFIDSVNTANIVPIEGYRELCGDEIRLRTGIVTKGTKIEFLGAFAEWVYMADTHTREYGFIIDGDFKGRKIFLGDLFNAQRRQPIFYEYQKP
ncbi:hypothetical protein [Desulforegula conservatrix]|uniref:hypothetical protein n=1 Tax=Desulforegula conservatrix TaxID=153026 RepID=UPI00048A3EA3|nr:hypothetical protein [Desulforegula conservatrix]